jgi:hypothetical protein
MEDAGFIYQQYLCQDLLLPADYTKPVRVAICWWWKWVNTKLMPLSFLFITDV